MSGDDLTPIAKNYTAIDSEFAGGGRGPSAGSGLIAVFFLLSGWAAGNRSRSEFSFLGWKNDREFADPFQDKQQRHHETEP